MGFRTRRRMEKAIARRIIKDALAEGWSVRIDNGAEEELPPASTDLRTIMAGLFLTDEDVLYFFKDGVRQGWVCLIYGNDGWDVVNDYTANLEAFMEGASSVADELEEQYGS
jgi:hypothetical protein